MDNSLFNQSLLRKYGEYFKPTHKQKEVIRDYIEKVDCNEFKGETKNYLKFYDIILKEVLGYGLDDVNFDEKVDTGTGRREFVLKSHNKKFMVV